MQRTITIPANGTYPLRVKASVLVITAANNPFDVETDRDGIRTMAVDRKLGTPGGRPFTRLIFYETAGTDNTVTFYLGDTDFISNTPSNTGITAGFGAPFVKTNATPGTPVPLKAASKWFRKARLIARRDLNALGGVANTGNVVIGGGDSAVGKQAILLAPGDELTIEAPAGQTWDFYQVYLDVANAGDGVAIAMWSA